MKRIFGLRRTTLTIPEDTLVWLRDLGRGNISRGIRLLHQRYKSIEYPVGRPKKRSSL